MERDFHGATTQNPPKHVIIIMIHNERKNPKSFGPGKPLVLKDFYACFGKTNPNYGLSVFRPQ